MTADEVRDAARRIPAALRESRGRKLLDDGVGGMVETLCPACEGSGWLDPGEFCPICMGFELVPEGLANWFDRKDMKLRHRGGQPRSEFDRSKRENNLGQMAVGRAYQVDRGSMAELSIAG